MRETLCMGCMRDKGEAVVCPYCGYEEGTPQYAAYLPPRTMIDSRYLVGRVLSYNGEGVLYIGYDCMRGERVDIREFFPDTLAVRDADGRTVRVLDGRQIPFKANMSDYTEILGKLIRMRTLSCVVQVLGWVEANNTVYAVLEHVEGLPLREYLLRKGAMLSWQETSDLLLPAIRTLSLLHQDEILHRGLSADTVFVTAQNTVKIGGFAVSAVRAARTELAAELFPGYSAPEQYSSVNPHGPWTDVYAVCALLYACLTGQRPPEALIRSADKELMPPRERNETVPAYVSDAILQGLELDARKRIQTMDQLADAITGAPSQPIVVVPAAEPAVAETETEEPIQIPPVRRPSFKKKEEKEEKTAYYRPASSPATHTLTPEEAEGREAERRRSRKLVLNSMLIALPILLLALIISFWLLFGGRDSGRQEEESSEPSLASEEWLVSSYPDEESGVQSRDESSREESSREESSEPSREESSGEESSAAESSRAESSAESSEAAIFMENFVGQKYADVVASAEYKDVYIFATPTYEYSEDYEEGVVMDQDITPGLEITAGTRVNLTVSRGSRYIRLPSYEKQTEQAYTARLASLGVPYVVVYREDDNYPSGYVVGLSVSDNLYDITSGATVEVYVSQE